MSASDPTITELYTAVNAAIYDLLTGKMKSFSLAGRSYTKSDLDELRLLRRELKKEYDLAVNLTGQGMVGDLT